MEFGYNGVGSRELPFDVSDYIFDGAAVAHDFSYFVGCTEEDRAKADYRFLKEELNAIRVAPIGKHLKYGIIAIAYFLALRWVGHFAFEYGDKPVETFEELRSRIDTSNLKPAATWESFIKRVLFTLKNNLSSAI